MNPDKTDPISADAAKQTTEPSGDRKPWVPPTAQRLDLREAMAGGGAGAADGVTSS